MTNSLPITDNIIRNLKDYRKAKRLTQKELGEKIHKSEISIRKYESGTVNIPIPVFFDISRALGVDFIYLLTNEDGSISDSEKKIYEDIKEFDLTAQNFSIENLNHLEEYIKDLGYEINGDFSEGYLVVNAPDGEYEITTSDLEDLKCSTKSFIEFKLHEIIKKSRKIGK